MHCAGCSPAKAHSNISPRNSQTSNLKIFHYIAASCIVLLYITLDCITLQKIGLHYAALNYTETHCTTLHYIWNYIWNGITLNYIELYSVKLHSITLHCFGTPRKSRLHCIASHRWGSFSQNIRPLESLGSQAAPKRNPSEKSLFNHCISVSP